MGYIIGWESKITGKRGMGTAELSYEEGKAWVDNMNTKWPQLRHWLLPPGPQREYFLNKWKPYDRIGKTND